MIHFDLQLQRPGFHLQVASQLPPEGVTALFGRSGCGKTTLLRCLAGLESGAQGHLQVNGVSWQGNGRSLTPQQRPVGVVFQEGRLFPHLNVSDNLHYGYRRTPVAQRQLHPPEAVELLGLGALLQRRPDQLSGGQRQRVAIGRALLTSPQLLLMDEPLAALDALSKAEILPWLEKLHRNLSMPVIYVSHALDEVTRLADHMLLMEEGKLLAQGSLQELLTRTDLPLSHGDNALSVLAARVTGYAPGDYLMQLRIEGSGNDQDGGQLWLPCHQPPAVGTVVRLRLAARDMVLSLSPPEQASVLNVLPAQVLEISPDPHPAHRLVRLGVGQNTLLARITLRSLNALALVPGSRVYAQIKAVAVD
ncbi:MAG: molybdenum ABC transporter ATP-binding protein [Halomonadaceae bacterium]|nr:MAG: molybdenum ABC transporter ATP-binding protein [Halomonadaceae bacterium]